jgi:adenylosuccinate lyase
VSLQSIHAISPIDGRYAAAVKPLQAYFSEFGLIRYRVLVENTLLRSQLAYPN